MNKQILKYSAAVALLLNSSDAKAAVPHADGTGGSAPCVLSYSSMDSDAEGPGVDIHSAQGCEVFDGSIVTVGSGLQLVDGEAAGANGWVMKTNPNCIPPSGAGPTQYAKMGGKGKGECTKYDWLTKIGEQGQITWTNWVAEAPDGSLIVAGLESDPSTGSALTGYSNITIWKLNAVDGSIIWKMTHKTDPILENGSTIPATSGLESVQFTEDGGFIVGGFQDAETPSAKITFKSGGQIGNGKPFLAKVSAQDAAGTTAPSGFEWIHVEKDPVYVGSVKTMRIVNDVIYANAGCKTQVVEVDGNSGQVIKKSGSLSNMQGGDLEVDEEGNVIITGHGGQPKFANGMIQILAGIQKYDKDYNLVWKKDLGNYPGGINQFSGYGKGDDKLIYNECWGLTASYDEHTNKNTGYIMACGTGIEGCNMHEGTPLGEKCSADPRVNWRGLVIKVDTNGDEVWHRQDSNQWQGDEAELPAGTQTVGSSASEYIFTLSTGAVVSVADENMGMGLAIIDATGPQCTTEHKGRSVAPNSLVQGKASHKSMDFNGFQNKLKLKM